MSPKSGQRGDPVILLLEIAFGLNMKLLIKVKLGHKPWPKFTLITFIFCKEPCEWESGQKVSIPATAWAGILGL